MRPRITDEERAGAIEPFLDAALYDWEYRRRRADVAFYRMLAQERLGRRRRPGGQAGGLPGGEAAAAGRPVLDLGCGTGRLALPLARDGHFVVGVDLSSAMLARATARSRRAGRAVGNRCLLVRADLKALPLRGHFPLAIAAFHTLQHLMDDRDLVALFRAVRRLIAPDGWFAFDVFFPDPRWLARPPNRQYDRTVFRHPATGRRLAYSLSHRLDEERRALHMTLRYQPIRDDGSAVGQPRVVRLCHRQLSPQDVEALLQRSGLKLLDRWSGFAGEPWIFPPTASSARQGDEPSTEQHVYLVGPGP